MKGEERRGEGRRGEERRGEGRDEEDKESDEAYQKKMPIARKRNGGEIQQHARARGL